MIYQKYPRRRIVQTIPGSGTGPDGDILVDDRGGRWKRVIDDQISILNSGTAIVPIARIFPDGTIA